VNGRALTSALTGLFGVVALMPASGGAGTAVSRAAAIPAGLIAYDRGDRVELSDLSGANRRILVETVRRARVLEPSWSPDGRELAFARGGDVFVVEVSTARLTRVAHLAAAVGDIFWSPDGRRLAFGWASARACDRHRASDAGLFVADLTVARLHELQSVEPRPRPRRQALFYKVVGWSPDGRRVLYVEERWAEGDCGLYLGSRLYRTTVFQVGETGGRPTRAAYGGPAEWSPTRPLIASANNRTRPCPLTVADPRGRGRRTIVEFGNTKLGCRYPSRSARWFMWSPLGDELFVVDDDHVFFAVSANGRRQRTLLRDPGFRCRKEYGCPSRLVAASADGRFLIVETHGSLVALATDGTERARLPHPGDVPFSVYMP
jgi:dipeptidyl aminopeptidase/acylaminoacyl peptidase